MVWECGMLKHSFCFGGEYNLFNVLCQSRLAKTSDTDPRPELKVEEDKAWVLCELR